MGSSKKVVGFGELLLRLGTSQYQRFAQARSFDVFYTGAEANALVSLVNFGLEGYAVSKVPANDIGQACINFLKGHGLNTDYIVRGGDRLGLFYLETGASQRASTSWTRSSPKRWTWSMSPGSTGASWPFAEASATRRSYR